MKIFVVELNSIPEKFFIDKLEAHRWAEKQYGCHQDGICINGVEIVAYVPIDT